MNILFVTPNNPFDIFTGGNQRTNLLLNACAKIANVDVIAFSKCQEGQRFNLLWAEEVETPQTGRLQKFMQLCMAWHPWGLASLNKQKQMIIDEACKKKHYDYIVIRYVHQAIECGLLKYKKRLIVDVDDTPYDAKMRDSLNVKSYRNKIFYILTALLSKIALRSFVNQVHVCFFSNSLQAKIYRSPLLPNVPYYDVNIEDIEPRKIVPQRLMFIGDMAYSPNIIGANHFLKHVFPMIRKRFPQVSFHIVGRVFDESLKEEWMKSGAVVTGFVDSIIQEYAEAECVVVPIYSGGGTCIKILEAMQMMRPIVTTQKGFRGYDDFFTNNEDIMVAKNDEDFVNAVSLILSCKELQKEMSLNAKMKYEQYFSKQKFFDIVWKHLTW